MQAPGTSLPASRVGSACYRDKITIERRAVPESDSLERALLTPEALICDDHAWRYPSRSSAPGGYARLRIWSTLEGPLLAVVTECGIGTSVMNSADGIRDTLQERFDQLDLVILEHWPAGDLGRDYDSLDHVFVDDNGRTQWNRIDPLNTFDERRQAWMREHGRRILDAGGPWSLPPALVTRLNAEIHNTFG